MSTSLPDPAARRRSAIVSELDQAMEAVLHERPGPEQEVVAMELHTAFLRAAEGPLAASARITGGGRSVGFCEAEVRNAAGQVVATAMGTYRILPKATAGESPCT